MFGFFKRKNDGLSESDRILLEAAKSTVKRGRLFDQMTSYQALKYVEKLREEGKNVNVTDSKGQTLLHRFPALAYVLIEEGLDPNLLDDHGDTPLIIAARKGDVMPALIQATSKENLNKIYGDGRTILTTLLTKGNGEHGVLLLWSLLEAGADPNLADKFGKTPLQIWLENRYYGVRGREFALALIKYGAKTDGIMMTVESRQKHTYQVPLIMHIMRSGVMGRSFLEALDKVDLTARDTDGNTMMIDWAVNSEMSGWGNKVFDKLKQVVDINARNNEGLTALNAAIKKGIYYEPHAGRVISLSREKCIAKLLEAGADFTIPDNNLKTPLHYAAELALANVVVDLVERGADVCAVDKDGLKPFDYTKNKIIRAYLKIVEEQQPKRVTSHSNHMSAAQKGHENTHA